MPKAHDMLHSDGVAAQLVGNPAAVQRVINRLALLIDINASIGSSISLAELLRKLSQVTKVVMDVESSALALVDHLNNELVFQEIQPEGHVTESVRIPVGKGIAGWVARYGIPLIIPDVSQDPRFYGGGDRQQSDRVRSVICVPLRRGDKIVGVLEALNKKGGKVFDEDDLAIFYSLANIAAIALENAQLYQLLSQKLIQLQDTNTHLNNILSELKESEAEVRALKQQMAREGTLVGRLELFAPTNLLQMLNNDQKTGTLVLEHQDWRGSISFDNGRIYHANMHGTPHLAGNMALYEMIVWHAGTFSFVADEISNNQTISDSCMHLIIEGLRRSDELRMMQEVHPWEGLVEFTEPKQAQKIEQETSATARAILGQITGQQSLQDIWKRCSVDRHTFYNTLKDLCEKQLIRVREN